MKNAMLLLLLFTALFSQKTAAQQTVAQPERTQKVRYTVSIQMQGDNKQMGSIYSTQDSSLVLAKTYKWFQSNITKTESIPVTDIKIIQAKKRGQAGKGVLIGMGVGVVIGALIGYSSYKEPPPPQGLFDFNLDFGPGLDAIGGGLVGLPSGALLGGIIGANIKQTFPINGNQNTYAAQREKLKRLSITGQ